jgi:hypothetical protein
VKASAEGAGERLFLLGVPDSDHGAVDGVFLYTMDANTGVVQRQNLPKLGIGDPLQFFDVTGGRLVYYGINGTTFSIDTDLRGPPIRLGPSLTFVPSATDGRVWLEGPIRASSDPDRYIPIKEVTVDGNVVIAGRSTRPPCPGPGIAAAVRQAVLCQAPPNMIASDPRTGRRIGRVPGSIPLATGGDLVASCTNPCPKLVVSDPVAGKTLRIDPQPGFEWQTGYEGAFSPDGTRVAVPVKPTKSRPGPREHTMRVAIVNLQDRSARLIHGSEIREGGALDFSSSGESLFFETPEGDVMEYRPGERSLHSIGSAGRITVYDLVAS